MNRLLRRISVAISAMDIGVSVTAMNRDLLGSVNTALRGVGGAQLPNLEEEGALLRAAIVLESAVP